MELLATRERAPLVRPSLLIPTLLPIASIVCPFSNCGHFRAVRDISLKPIRKGDLESLLVKMDQPDGVTHRGKELLDRRKRHKKAMKEKRGQMLKSRLTRISMMAMHPSFNALSHLGESRSS